MTISTGAILGAAALSAAGAGLSGWLNNRHQKKMYEQQVRDARSNWAKENIYNSPAAQMQRFRAAGLNPNLIYQNGANASSGALETPSLGNTGAYDNFIGAGVDTYSSLIQSNQVTAYTDYLSSLKNKTDTETAGIRYDNIFKAAKSEFAHKWVKREFDNLAFNGALMEAQTNNFRQNTKLLYEQTGITEQEKLTYMDRFHMDMTTARQHNLLTGKSIAEIEQRINNMRQEVVESKQRVNESKANVALMAQMWNSLQVDIARAKIAKSVEQAEANWKLSLNSKDYVDSNGAVMRSNLAKQLNLELDKLERDFKYMTWDRVNETVRSVGTGVGTTVGTFLLRGKNIGKH